MGGMMGGGGASGGAGKADMRPGDWHCPGCNDLQFARNPACRKCGTPKPANAGGMSMGMPTSMVGRGGATDGGRPGDWKCPQCGDLQFAKNSTCRMCQAPKPTG